MADGGGTGWVRLLRTGITTLTAASTFAFASPRSASADERALADAVVAGLPPTAYARVDLLPGRDGPVVLEVELVEPSRGPPPRPW